MKHLKYTRSLSPAYDHSVTFAATRLEIAKGRWRRQWSGQSWCGVALCKKPGSWLRKSHSSALPAPCHGSSFLPFFIGRRGARREPPSAKEHSPGNCRATGILDRSGGAARCRGAHTRPRPLGRPPAVRAAARSARRRTEIGDPVLSACSQPDAEHLKVRRATPRAHRPAGKKPSFRGHRAPRQSSRANPRPSDGPNPRQ